MKEFELKVFSGSANRPLAEAMARHLKTRLSTAKLSRFKDSEILLKIDKSVRGKDVYIVQSLSAPCNEHIMELLLFIDAVKRASAERVTAVIPYMAYARQDKRFEPHIPVSAKVLAKAITVTGADRVLTMELHSAPIEAFFDIPVDNLSAEVLFLEYIHKKKLRNLVVVAPDEGAMKRSTKFAKKIGAGLAFINKIRPKENVAKAVTLIGEVKGKNCLIIDDMVDTGGTIVAASDLLKKEGARKVLVLAAHGVLSGDAVEKINGSRIDEVVLTDSILPKKKSKKINVVSISRLFAKAIKKIHYGSPMGPISEFRGKPKNKKFRKKRKH